MDIELYIGTDQLDFNEQINVVFSVGDIRDLALGNLNKSYTLNIPLTKTNKTILKHSETPGITDEITSTGRLYVNKMLIIAGTIIIISVSQDYARIIINSDDWMETMKNTNLRDIDFSDDDHTMTKTNIVASWSAANAFYRYPMINFGQLVTEATGTQPHDWGVNDFIPMFRVIDIMEYIFAPWTIVSDWIATTYAKKLYILAPELIADNDFIANKGLQKQVQTASDNQYSDTIDDGITKDFTLADGNMDFKAGTDEAVAYSDADDWYVIPETGTYCFTFIARPNWTTYAGITINSQQLILAIKRTRDASTDTLITETYNYVASDILSGITYTLEAGYIHFEAGDKVFCTRYMTQNLSNSGVTRTITMNFTATTTEFNLTWNDWCRHPGKNKTITASDYMPDILAIDFIRAVKHLANLRFFADYQNQNIYIEPAQTFFAIDGETDLSELQDNEDYTLEPISPNYKKSIILGLIEDEKDKAYMEYKESQGITDQKTITLSSEYAEDGEQEMINPLFAHSAIGFFHEILAYGLSVFKIFGDQEYMETKPYPEYRATGWEPRLVTWEGLTAGISFDIEETTYNTYPKILPADFDDLYDNYWITSIHRIDKNMILTMRIKLPQGAMNQLRTVINDSSQEGFRTRYKLFIRNQYIYGYLNKVTTDGDISECEFILKN